MNELRQLIRYANISLAVTIPTFAIGAILLRDAGEAVLQALALAMIFFAFAVLFALDELGKRRRRRDQ